MQQQRFHIHDRIRILRSVGWLIRGSQGSIVCTFYGTDTYGVRFDHQTSIHLVIGEQLEQIGTVPHQSTA